MAPATVVEAKSSEERVALMPCDSLHFAVFTYCCNPEPSIMLRACSAVGLLFLVLAQAISLSSLLLGMSEGGPCLSRDDCYPGNYCETSELQGTGSLTRSKWWRHEPALGVCTACDGAIADTCGNTTLALAQHVMLMCKECGVSHSANVYVDDFDIPALNVASMRPISSWLVLAMMSIVIAGILAKEVEEMDTLQLMLRSDADARKGEGSRMRLAMFTICFARRYLVLVTLIGTVVLFVLVYKSDAVSIALNAVATLVFVEVDNCAFYALFDQRHRAAIIATPVEATRDDATRIERSKRIHCIGVVISIVGGVALFGNLARFLTFGATPLAICAIALPMIFFAVGETQLVASTTGSKVLYVLFVLLAGPAALGGGLIGVFSVSLGWM